MENKKIIEAGFGRVDITSQMGIYMPGFIYSRYAEGVLDPMQANVLAIKSGDKTVLLLSLDNVGITAKLSLRFRKAISEKTGVPIDAIFMHCTHTHTGPALCDLESAEEMKAIEIYRNFVEQRCVDASTFAIADLKPAKMGYGVAKAPNVAFVRRYRMKDGSVQTNPGIDNPEILHPIGKVDEMVSVVRFDRENAETIVLFNFANHPDTVGGCKLSGDWPHFARHFVEKAIDNTKSIFFNGPQGDINDVNVHPTKGDLNDLVDDGFDGPRGYGHARHIGRCVAGAVMQIYDKVNYTDKSDIFYAQKDIEVPAQVPDKKDIPLAKKYMELHNAGKDDEIPYEGMMLTTVVAEARRMLRLENGPNSFIMPLSVLSFGDIAMVGIPGEPFSGIGLAIKEAKGYDLIMPCCITNGYQGYFPMKEAYDEGGYETRGSSFKSGVAEIIIDESIDMLKNLRK